MNSKLAKHLEDFASKVPRAPIISDEAVAKLLIREAQSRSSSVLQSDYIFNGKPKDINKVYLANTIRNVESHNRREEVADCWRQKEMIAKADDKELKEIVIGKRKSSARVSDVTERELWSSRKAQKFGSESQLNGDSSVNSKTGNFKTCVEELSIKSELKHSGKNKKEKKSKSKKKKKDKKQKKEKKKTSV